MFCTPFVDSFHRLSVYRVHTCFFCNFSSDYVVQDFKWLWSENVSVILMLLSAVIVLRIHE